MAQAAERSTTSNHSDAALLAMIEHHDILSAKWDLAVKRAPMNGAPTNLIHETCDLQRKIVATPAFTSTGLDAKIRIVRHAEFDDDDGIIATILELDAERVAR
ncbi:hypothetical protein J4G48_0003455 [Bradyrhizobium barranii subsp. apii]|uniref:hypothetical protein n=1 Tax=Bradyrhizobium barranii TaxID=2992140 RepID=UPI001AA10D26|nr:hypothetical protein [Bradyrhizobium barranii]UPT97252.1 hypothetical protein J4G48_0003455 [Bradyrhizobium barranii subsp. apii]